ncbi:MAG: alpha/beta fold hydrolase [Deltaproteobacteria bacterium]|nr:alpha/beta fold hydrolase [Deltaproteobacteria bacterium]
MPRGEQGPILAIMRKLLVRSLVGILVFGLVVPVAGAWYIAGLVPYPSWLEHRSPEQGLRPLPPGASIERSGDPGSAFDYSFEEIEFAAADGRTLRGWFIPGFPGARAAVVAVHGAGSDRRGFLPHLPIFHKVGYPVVLFDCRDHGISDATGLGLSFGVREHEDISSAVAWMKRRKDIESVAVIGTSQGGGSVLIAAALDPNIDAVISENPFTNLGDLLRDTDSEAGSPPDALSPLIAWFTLLRSDGLDLPSPLEATPMIAPRPLLLMHGTADRLIPYAHSEELLAVAGEPVELWLAEGARHGRLINRYPEEYSARMRAFLLHSVGAP